DDQRVELRAGVWRYHPVRHQFEVFAHGGSNQWGLDFDQMGQLFMTHCRSYWGRGSTTHVIQGGHYWNQSNRHHAPYISGAAPAALPHMENYLLASARYGHGEGGAGKRGSRVIYGGHSHVGTMIYLGDNWPAEYHGKLFSHNLHGHQLNQQVNEPEGSGFNTVHAGFDVLYCHDPRYVAVDLQYGPDGSVYMTDWCDQRHCHNPNTEQWDRTNGRIYRVSYQETYHPVQVDLASMSDAELVDLQRHRNEWFARTARRILQERSAAQQLTDASATSTALVALTNAPDPAQRLRGFWALHAIGHTTASDWQRGLSDSNEYVRAWTLQLLGERREPLVGMHDTVIRLAKYDPSPVVRLYLASLAQRVAPTTAWDIVAALAQHAEDAEDRNLPKMVWIALAQLLPADEPRAQMIASTSKLPTLNDYATWYLAARSASGLQHVLQQLEGAPNDEQLRLLELVNHALRGERDVTPPAIWKQLSASLYVHSDARIRELSEDLGATFRDATLYPRFRDRLADRDAPVAARRRAFAIVAEATDQETLPLLLSLLDDDAFRSLVIPQLAKYTDPTVATALVERFEKFSPADQEAALSALTRRVSSATALLDAVASHTIGREHLTAYHIRSLTNLKNDALNARIAEEWGTVGETSAQKQEQIDNLVKAYSEAPLWAYEHQAGRQLFQKICANCHEAAQGQKSVGPNLAGSGPKGARYFIENLVDPNAVIGNDFMMQSIETVDGAIISGIIEAETETAITVRTQTEQIVLPKSEVDSMVKTQVSLMPEQQLDTLNDRQKIELLKYLNSL
ncbi:MAG: c-type cytochrome, partial [Planctomycetales bacterium]|nr:c-type cytochrome [Planctomycetales bacterium]